MQNNDSEDFSTVSATMLAWLLDEARLDILKRDAERKILVQTRSAKTVDAIRISMDILDSGTTIPV